MCGEPRPNAISLARLTPHTVDDLEVEAIALEPVDVVHLTTLVDNLYDALLGGQETITRAPLAAGMAEAP